MSESKINDGGPAFPTHPQPGITRPPEWHGGMSLRDWLAGQALAMMRCDAGWSDNPLYWEHVARSAYVAADAMLASRSAE